MTSSMRTRDDLDQAVDGLYSAFGPYRLGDRVEGCPCCVSTRDVDRLHSKPLRALEHEDLAKFGFQAMSTWGMLEDFKLFLPRLLELLSIEWDGWFAPEVLLGQLAYGEWRSWPRHEQESVERYLMALWRFILSVYPAPITADECLCGIGQSVDDLGPYLETRSTDTEPTAFRLLAQFVVDNVQMAGVKGKLGAFWRGRRTQERQLVEWLLAPATAEVMEQAFFRFAEEPFADELAYAADLLKVHGE